MRTAEIKETVSLSHPFDPRTTSNCLMQSFSRLRIRASFCSYFLFVFTTAFPLDCRFSSCPINRNMHKSTEMKMTESKIPVLLISMLDKISVSESATAKLVLASQSPRRREILDMMMLKGKYTVEPSPLDESKLQSELMEQNLSPQDYTCTLARAKALSLAESHRDSGDDSGAVPTYYLGSDTTVDLDGSILEKPKDPEEAKVMLRSMSGRQHHVHTGVAIYKLHQKEISLVSSFTDSAKVTFCKLSSDTINAYVASGEPLDKAGSYGIQGIGGQLVTDLQGDFFTVMGLPMHKTSNALAKALNDD